MKKVPFYKMQGSGNDFILIDNRRNVLKGRNLIGLARTVCDRHFSVGADGLIVIVPPSSKKAADFKWRFYNADGSEAEMCGNGSRCAARFAVLRKIALNKMAFETLAGIIHADVKGERVKVQLPEATGLRLNISVPLDNRTRSGHFINTGVPHVVYLSEDLDSVDVQAFGRATRYHELFRPAGTNVNFVEVAGPRRLRIRTYERGVEGETLACGTGAVAAALISSALGKVKPPVEVVPRSGEKLVISFEQGEGTFGRIFLDGEAKVICEGNLFLG
jgi:diaminopimelate epimerase